jgi:DNA (cytosine-5)-methyltransferase 1
MSNRIPKVQLLDASIHPERSPTEKKLSTSRKGATEFTFIELFSGIGGFGLALEALGGRCVFASELDEDCRAVYAKNMGPVPLFGDIYQVPDSSIPSGDDAIDLLVGGFPCQPFSNLGTQPGFDDKVKGQLYLQIVRVLKLSQPRAFLLENVPGLLRMTEAFNTIVAALESAGYYVSTQVCSSRGLTATSRKRLFFVGLRHGNNDDCFEFPFVPDLGLRALDVIDYWDEADTDLMTLLRLSDAQMDQLRHKSKQWKPAKLAWPDVTIDTLDSHYGVTVGKGNSQLVPCPAPSHPRRFSPMECARVMGFPASTFVFLTQSETQGDMAYLKKQYHMFGNAVCPPLIAAIAGAVIGSCRPELRDAWVVHGRNVAMQLAVSAVLPSRQDPTWTRLRCNYPNLFNS